MRPDKPQARTVGELGQLIGAELPDPEGRTVKISGLTHDSRQVRPGDLYAAMLGENTHGAAFVKQAAEAGAVAILTDPLGRERSRLAGLPVLVANDARASLGAVAAAVYGEPAAAMLTIGVTGTNGKTTTAFMLESGLRAAGRSTGLFGTVTTRISDESGFTPFGPSARTTPEAPDLHALLAVMKERGVDAVAMEVSSHALDLHRVDGVVYDAALFTNLSHDHLDWHFTLEAYFQAKAVLFTPAHAKAGVVNLDDPYGKRLTQNRQIPITTFSATGDEAADWRAVAVKLGPAGSTFTVQGPKGAGASASIGLPGAFNVANALGAIVALVVAGLPLKAAVDGVAACPGVPGRMEKVDAGQDYLAVVDYAHTPHAIETILTALRPVTSGRLIVVLGAGGDRDKTKRPLMGEVAARLGDVLVLTDDNPRSEDPKEILAAVKAGADGVDKADRAELHVEHDRAKAIALAVSKAAAGDAVVVAGKGHEQGQEIKGEVKPFDDREVLGDALLAAEPGPAGSARGSKK
ncbi:UDP-N-acetylmuramoyl-L-alanyl-D-glutamate--2,6-diaminopimelate ligase [Sporichthya sp.]|uniref:UDP-N-acetylmuramoyl-L-alanyl-D-glutamate--2, 6-diaminopimelate ligase n=1 Tax=Sporichthya sp. TaxID=65475 RepID=UPI0018098BE6|nr:UDP-N-acetylmuramoyl-L-alanyl-D-glutamate--2,6-diaminopimelate ligase [Sporichthya sp.]